VNGHYFTEQAVVSLTAEGGAIQAACAAAYPGVGYSTRGITLLTYAETGLAQYELREAVQVESGGMGGLGFEQVLFVQSSGTFANQVGVTTTYLNQNQTLTAPYTATAVILDTQSFFVTVTATLPVPMGSTGTGTCVQVQDWLLVHSADY